MFAATGDGKLIEQFEKSGIQALQQVFQIPSGVFPVISPGCKMRLRCFQREGDILDAAYFQ